MVRDRDQTIVGHPDASLDATYCKAQLNHRVVFQVVVVGVAPVLLGDA
jgi:hypothetical protein